MRFVRSTPTWHVAPSNAPAPSRAPPVFASFSSHTLYPFTQPLTSLAPTPLGSRRAGHGTPLAASRGARRALASLDAARGRWRRGLLRPSMETACRRSARAAERAPRRGPRREGADRIEKRGPRAARAQTVAPPRCRAVAGRPQDARARLRCLALSPGGRCEEKKKRVVFTLFARVVRARVFPVSAPRAGAPQSQRVRGDRAHATHSASSETPQRRARTFFFSLSQCRPPSTASTCCSRARRPTRSGRT